MHVKIFYFHIGQPQSKVMNLIPMEVVCRNYTYESKLCEKVNKK